MPVPVFLYISTRMTVTTTQRTMTTIMKTIMRAIPRLKSACPRSVLSGSSGIYWLLFLTVFSFRDWVGVRNGGFREGGKMADRRSKPRRRRWAFVEVFRA